MSFGSTFLPLSLPMFSLPLPLFCFYYLSDIDLAFLSEGINSAISSLACLLIPNLVPNFDLSGIPWILKIMALKQAMAAMKLACRGSSAYTMGVGGRLGRLQNNSHPSFGAIG